MPEKPDLVLASGSPRRRELLERTGLRFTVDAPEVDEHTGLPPREAVQALSRWKALAGAGAHPGRVILAADTLVAVDDQPLGKPADEADAMRMLRLLSGRWHQVYTGVCVMSLKQRKMLFGHEVSRCKARKLSSEQLEHLAGKHMDKAGAYAVQDNEDPFIERIVGSKTNVVGFPVEFFQKLYEEFLA